MNSNVLIGTWRYYDESGSLTKIVDEEEKFELWSFNKVLDVLDKDKVIDLKTERNRVISANNLTGSMNTNSCFSFARSTSSASLNLRTLKLFQ